MNILDILKGKFLINKNSYRIWNFIIFITILSLISITNSHIMDYKIRKIHRLVKEIKKLQNDYTKNKIYKQSDF